MSREEIFSRIEAIAKKIFGENTRITETTTSADVEKWDSMNHVLLISSIEKEFGVTFDIMEIIGITCFGDFVDLVEKNQP
ncbi:MAG TPA: acyl carrier protein [Prolixibacteraceae bacterium]|nr:acyl carrier protein [Prolixibacteraceae bacterium]